jgi:hypothetical protein
MAVARSSTHNAAEPHCFGFDLKGLFLCVKGCYDVFALFLNYVYARK